MHYETIRNGCQNVLNIIHRNRTVSPMSKPGSVMLDLEDRDPNNLSQHLQVLWDDVVGEPEGIRSPECSWRLSTQCFTYSRNCCYVFLAVVFSPITAVCLGCTFACLAFEHIWCITPCIRVWKISCAAIRNIVLSCVHAVVIPFSESLGHFWSNIKVRTQMLPEGPDRKEDPLVV